MATFELIPAEGLGAPVHVDGDITPDATGYYYEIATWNDWRCYARHDAAYHLWSAANNQHYITTVVDELGPGYWWNTEGGAFGEYSFKDGYLGVPTVTKQRTISMLGKGTTVQRPNPTMYHPRRTGKRRKEKSKRQTQVENALARCVRLWNELSPAMKLHWIGDGLTPLVDRSRKKFLARGLRRWIQVQMPLMLAGLPLEASTKQRTPYQVINLHVTQIDDEGQHAELEWEWKRQSEIDERVVLHVSQLRPDLIGRVDVSKYARLVASADYSVYLEEPGWQQFWLWVPLPYQPQRGTTIQLYARFELMDNPNPPTSDIGSLMTTEDWTDLAFFFEP